MKIEVKVKSAGQLEQGVAQSTGKEWAAREVVFEANDGSMYPDLFPVRVKGDVARTKQFRVGEEYLADIQFNIREYNGRNYQELYLRNLGASEKAF